MEVLAAPSTPDNPQAHPSIRRSFTLPNRLNSSPKSSPPAGAAGAIDTLYTHDAARIVFFSPMVGGPRRHSSVEQGHSAQEKDPVGTLPWASLTERTIAAGPLRFYRANESAAFLHSGSTLRPILPKSRCWCVDGESKFVLRTGRNDYYRIELPTASADDRLKVEELKITLGKLLQYETTPCPFKRGFTVDLPERPQTRTRPWRPRERTQPTPTSEGSPTVNRARRLWEKPGMGLTLENAEYPSPDEDQEDLEEQPEDMTDSVPQHSASSSDQGHESEATEGMELTPKDAWGTTEGKFDSYKTPTRPVAMSNGRATTAPSQLSLKTVPPSNAPEASASSPSVSEDTTSLSSSMDSFHSFHSPISPLPPSPTLPLLSSSPGPDNDISLPVNRVRSHKRDDSEMTITADDHDIWGLSPMPTAGNSAGDFTPPADPQTPTLVSDTTSQSVSPEAITPSPVQLRHRKNARRQRSCSPPPSPTNLHAPRSGLSSHQHLTTAILQKTYALLMSPPSQLVALMLNIAAKIASGTYRGFSLGYGEAGQRIPCSWDFSDTDDSSHEEDELEEDDYGVSLRNSPGARSRSVEEVNRSWEID
ncbi:MAG: hypothetical protein LQ351_003887 [Letrouitia transgressa]|nr:MAG: hypothetical protein LQ351_003887 [Letrouitia transgressa]